jgi:hypothetical protein
VTAEVSLEAELSTDSLAAVSPSPAPVSSVSRSASFASFARFVSDNEDELVFRAGPLTTDWDPTPKLAQFKRNPRPRAPGIGTPFIERSAVSAETRSRNSTNPYPSLYPVCLLRMIFADTTFGAARFEKRFVVGALR